jgi:hypothetical protein
MNSWNTILIPSSRNKDAEGFEVLLVGLKSFIQFDTQRLRQLIHLTDKGKITDDVFDAVDIIGKDPILFGKACKLPYKIVCPFQ